MTLRGQEDTKIVFSTTQSRIQEAWSTLHNLLNWSRIRPWRQTSMNKSVLMAVPIIAIIVGTMTISSAHASLIGDFGIGYNDGKTDAFNGVGDGTCPGGSNSYCAGYHAGYVSEELTIQQAQP